MRRAAVAALAMLMIAMSSRLRLRNARDCRSMRVGLATVSPTSNSNAKPGSSQRG